MAKGIQKFTVQESVAPYTKAIVVSADTEYAPSRGICTANTAGEVVATLTFADGSTIIDFRLQIGTVYPFQVIKTDATPVAFLY